MEKPMASTKLAVQMFTVREFTKTPEDFKTTIEKIAAMGYTAVQISAVGCLNDGLIDAKGIKEILDANNIKCIATHRNVLDLINKTDEEIQLHKDLGCDYAAFGGLFGTEPYPQTIEGYRKFLADAKEPIAKFKAAGIMFGHHNHAHEFFRPELGGPRLYDILIDEGGDDLKIEADLFWVWHGGESPITHIRRCPNRVSVIHLKDKAFYYDEKNPNGIAPIGEGNMPWEDIIPVCEEMGVKWYCIEHDVCPRDPFDCLKSSFNYLNSKFGL